MFPTPGLIIAINEHIIELVRNKPGIKGVELASKVAFYVQGLNHTDIDSILAKLVNDGLTIDSILAKLVNDGLIIELEYVLPDGMDRIKSMFFPAGTEFMQ